ncbi:MAG: response regulator [Lachnospiraceae bacterium]|nr:response regulator [Lachnospiraceae bacterium]MEE0920661.1 response regulator [Lachnospiraceae bacterium]
MDRKLTEKNMLLIVDDVDINRAILGDIFVEQYQIAEAENGEEAIKELEAHKDEIALVFLDLQMPKKNGLDVLDFMNETGLINLIPVIMITGESTVDSDLKRVKTFTGILLYHLQKLYPEYELSDEQLKLIVNASALHDIGKIAIPDDILLKPGKLTRDEFEIMKTHTNKGCEILEMFKQEENEFYQYCYDICRYHHERYDGKGYPDQLSGEDIPIWAQVVSIIDVYDALVSKRVYKIPYAVEEAERMILTGECGTFSPKIIDCFEAAKLELFQLTEGKFSFVEG